ncbi:hypothetical protein M9H77_26624 [Catharanthus roseus]|uniref:Uncharacterized protein n=1 Tax=Catharanthus roseus TaxID=4058 RepID=A0ACC0AB59_CATRO|nr:hypothetical protein M9H77_26624 [Catharanthus roseus]
MDLFEDCLKENVDFDPARLTEEQLQQTEQFRKSHVLPRNILRFFREQDVGCAICAQKKYIVVTKIKKNRMQGRNMVEEVLCLNTQRGYTVFYRNYEESNVLSDIIFAHPTSIATIRMWSYVLIMDTTYKTNNCHGNHQVKKFRRNYVALLLVNSELPNKYCM